MNIDKTKVFHIHHSREINDMMPWTKHPEEIDMDNYDRVAKVRCETLDDAYRLTNHIDRPWWENDLVVKTVEREVRSTSIGDIIVAGHHEAYIVASVRFEPVTLIQWKD